MCACVFACVRACLCVCACVCKQSHTHTYKLIYVCVAHTYYSKYTHNIHTDINIHVFTIFQIIDKLKPISTTDIKNIIFLL